jgi:hypothetical protein
MTTATSTSSHDGEKKVDVSTITSHDNGTSQMVQPHLHQVLDEDDAAGLAAIGKTQAFDRRLNIWSVIGIAVCSSATVRPSLIPDSSIGGFIFIL